MNRRLLLTTSLAALTLCATAATASAQMVYRMATGGEPSSLDPHSVSGTWENYVVGDQFMGLTTEAADVSTLPGAAESWTVSDDGLTYTFKLRDHQWSDGEQVTAADFVFAWRRILDPNKAAEYASLLYPIKNAEAINSGEEASLESLGVRAIDDRTLEVKLEYPAGYFLQLLTHYTSYPLPQHVVERHGDDWTKPGNIVGNGAFRVVEWTPHSRIVADKNPNFWDAANVKLDQVIYYPDEERNSVLRRFRAGEIDMADEFAAEQIDFLKRELPQETRVFPKLGTYYYVCNTTRKPFDDPRVRQALSMALDRDAIAGKVIRTGELPAFGAVPPETGGDWQPYEAPWAATPYRERVAEAKALLQEAGFGPDNPLSFELSYNTSEDHKKVAIAAQAMWKQLGIQAALVNREVKVHYEFLDQANFDCARAGWIADYDDPQNFLYLLETRTGVKNYGRYSNPEYDRLMVEQSQADDPAQRDAIMKQAEQIAMGDHAWLPLWYYVSRALVSTKVQGYVDNAKHIHRSRWISVAG